MKRRPGMTAVAITALFALLVLAVPAAAQHEGHEGHGDMAGEMKAGDQGMGGHEMSAEEEAMMEAWAAAATPGPQHARIAKGAGHFKSTVKVYGPDPSADPEITEGTSNREMVLGDRVLVDHTDGAMMGQPFQGIGMTGYDNVEGEYWSTWMDTMGTGILLSKGDVDAQGRLAVTGSYTDAMTRDTKTLKVVTWWEGDDTEQMQLFEKRGDGWAKIMEITYQRQ